MKEAYDRTPVQLIRRRRLEAGARLLEEREDVTIGEVAYAVGFNSQSYFSRSFRDEFGAPPSEYRSEGVAA
jgi:AraC-like DNA-binding protein